MRGKTTEERRRSEFFLPKERMLVEKETGKIEERPKRKKKKEVIVVIVRLSISLRIPKIPKQKEGAQNSKGIDKNSWSQIPSIYPF